MSDGLARVAGGGVPIEFDGVSLVLPPMTVNHYATIEQHLLMQRPNPVELAKSILQGLDVEVQKHIMELAYHEMKHSTTIPPDELFRYLSSIEGLKFTIWMLLNDLHPGRWTQKRVGEIFNSMTNDQIGMFIKARDQSSGIDELGNSTGQTSEPVSGTLA